MNKFILALLLVACGDTHEESGSVESALKSFPGHCIIDPSTGLESGGCMANTPCGCFGEMTPDCVLGRTPNGSTPSCYPGINVDNVNCKVSSRICM